jgi:hypothetical protein
MTRQLGTGHCTALAGLALASAMSPIGAASNGVADAAPDACSGLHAPKGCLFILSAVSHKCEKTCVDLIPAASAPPPPLPAPVPDGKTISPIHWTGRTPLGQEEGRVRGNGKPGVGGDRKPRAPGGSSSGASR